MGSHHLERTKFSINVCGLEFHFKALGSCQGFIPLRVSCGRQVKEESSSHPWSPNTRHSCSSPLLGDTWLLSAGWDARAQLLPAKGCASGETDTYLGNLCFSFLRLCLVGGTDTRHWAISSYWALVSIMLGQGRESGGDKENTPWAPAALVPGDEGWAGSGKALGPSLFLACSYTPFITNLHSLGFHRQLGGGGRAVDPIALPWLSEQPQ